MSAFSVLIEERAAGSARGDFGPSVRVVRRSRSCGALGVALPGRRIGAYTKTRTVDEDGRRGAEDGRGRGGRRANPNFRGIFDSGRRSLRKVGLTGREEGDPALPGRLPPREEAKPERDRRARGWKVPDPRSPGASRRGKTPIPRSPTALRRGWRRSRAPWAPYRGGKRRSRAGGASSLGVRGAPRAETRLTSIEGGDPAFRAGSPR